MGLFKKKKKRTVEDALQELDVKFVIPQIIDSNDGIKKGKDPFERAEFSSSLFGSGIKDVITFPDNSNVGVDVNRTYDSFRSEDEKKIRDEDLISKYGTKFPEFNQISLETAKEVYGTEITVDKKKKETVEAKPTEFSFFKKVEENKQAEFSAPNINPNNTESKNDSFDFDFGDTNRTEPKQEEKKNDDFGFNFGLDDDSILSNKPTIHISELDDEEFFQTPKPSNNYSNVVRRTQEERLEIRREVQNQVSQANYQNGASVNETYKPANDYQNQRRDNFYNDTNNTQFDNRAFSPKEEKPIQNEKPYIPSGMNPYGTYIYPPIDRFKRTTMEDLAIPQWVIEKKEIINDTLRAFGLAGEVVSFVKGPTFTRYEVLMDGGVNVRKVLNIQDTIQADLGVKTIRIQAPIPGKRTVGIEVPNDKSQTVWFGDIISDDFVRDGKPLNVALGKDIDGNIITTDIAKWPHGLVAGSTGSGKSVCVNTILVSLLLKNKPDDLKLILVDPKMVELITYNDLPHLITPVITDSKVASQALKWAVEEMERRYQTLASVRVRSIKEYNDYCKNNVAAVKMPYIVIVIDEMADMMQVCSSDVEESVQRLMQKARSCGIHLLMATQRPSVDVIKGSIKANIPARVAFRVNSQVDSQTILNEIGAESLLGRGDMIIKADELNERLQGAFITNEEIDYVTDYIRAQSGPDYVFEHNDLKQKFESDVIRGANPTTETKEMLYECAKFILEYGQCSINALCQQFNLGYNRANKVVLTLEELNIVGPRVGTKAREVLVDINGLNEIFEMEF